MILLYIFAGRILGMVILLTFRFLDLKNKAKQKSRDFLEFQFTNDEAIRQITEKKDYNPIARFIDIGTRIYLFEKENTNIRIHSLNHTQERISTQKQYCQLERKFQNKKIFCECNIDKALIYYHFEKPYDKYILLLEHKYSGNIFKLT